MNKNEKDYRELIIKMIDGDDEKLSKLYEQGVPSEKGNYPIPSYCTAKHRTRTWLSGYNIILLDELKPLMAKDASYSNIINKLLESYLMELYKEENEDANKLRKRLKKILKQ